MSRTAALARGRQLAEQGMQDRCVIHITTGTALDETTGREVPTLQRIYPAPSSPHSDGPCEIVARNTVPREVDVAGRQLTLQAEELRLPVDTSTTVPIGAVATITHASEDPQLVGIRLRVQGPHHQTYATARRLAVEEIA
jgi:hypothetical protein